MLRVGRRLYTYTAYKLLFDLKKKGNSPFGLNFFGHASATIF